MRKFLILSSQRSGSTYLQLLLNSHSEIFMDGEIFNNSQIHIINKCPTTKDFVGLKNTDPHKYLDRFFAAGSKKGVKCAGFRLFYDHARNKNGWIWNILENTPDLYVIHLQRKNLLNQLLSLKLALRSSSWMRKKGAEQVVYEPLFIGYPECLKYFKAREQNIRKSINFFGGAKVLDIFYEEIETDRILEFLDLASEPLHCDILKQNLQKPSEVIANYYELKDLFKNTPWGGFFND